MKKILFINQCDYGSTGGIVKSLLNAAKKNGFSVSFARLETSGYQTDDDFFIGKNHGLRYQKDRFLCKIDGSDGFRSKYNTRKLCEYIEQIRPDVIHIHNMHGHYLNVPLLFREILKCKAKPIFTLHDCWTFTGKCPYFDAKNCEKWKTGCLGKCPDRTSYPRALFCSRTNYFFEKKKTLFQTIAPLNPVFVSPSNWLDGFVGESILSSYRHVVIHNGVNEQLFCEKKEKKKKNSKIILLGSAFPWTARKGLSDFNKLAESLDESSFEIWLVGLEAKDKTNPKIKRFPRLPQEELATLYQSADCFLNLSTSDNFPTVILESIACGTPVISYETGGACEMIDDRTGIHIPKNDVSCLKETITKLRQFDFDIGAKKIYEVSQERMANEYLSLYSKLQ